MPPNIFSISNTMDCVNGKMAKMTGISCLYNAKLDVLYNTAD